jgi:signal transduction histidine kinase
MFRALQEALANVARHAEARSVWVTLRAVDECLELVVRDDGRGLDGAAEKRGDAFTQHVGLAGMRERVAALGGRVTLANADGGGATLSVRVPIRDSSA